MQEKHRPTDSNDDHLAAIQEMARVYDQLRKELSKVIVGQADVIDQVLIAMLAGGHCLLEGVPGLAKTLLISSVAEALSLSFKRIQFTPDLMPSDITGTDVLQEDPISHERGYQFIKGPIFANMILGDEINRTPPKTQAAMLEAMQERIISAGGKSYELPRPFFVLATQNPLDQEGTYPLPEAQLDRFLLYIKVDYPSRDEEWHIARRVTSDSTGQIEPVINVEQILQAQQLVKQMPVCDQVVGYCLELTRATRPGGKETPDSISKWINWGAGPRGVIALMSCAKARALLEGRMHATIEDVKAIVRPALRHRVAANYAGLAEGITSERIIEMLLDEIPSDKEFAVPKTDLSAA